MTSKSEELIQACEKLDIDAVHACILAGADLDCRSIERDTPLLCVIDRVHHNPSIALQIANLLLSAGADIEARGYMDKTPFLKACSRGNLEMLRLLVQKGCDIHAVCMDMGPVSGLDFADIFHAPQEFKNYLRELYEAP